MKKIFYALLCLFSFTLNAQTVTVTLSSEKQLIRGFGGINHPVWAGDLTAAQRTTAFGNGAGQLGMSVLRMWISDNKNDWAKELPTAKRAIELGAIVFATPWNPPASMCETISRNNRQEKRLKPSSYAAYAQHLVDFVNYMKTNGVNLYAISFANEPDWGFDWTWYSTDEVYNFTKNNAGTLKATGVKVITAESFSYSKKYYDPVLNDAAALANVDIIGCHFYGSDANTANTFFQYPLADQKAANKERWMTEHYTDSDNDADLWPMAHDVSYEMHRALVEGQMSAYVWWYIRRKYSPMKEDGTISKRGYCYSQFSKFVRPGYVRVDATKNPAADVYVSAYKKGDNVVIVAVNRSTSSKTISVSVPGTKVKTWEKYVTSGSKNIAKETNISTTDGSFQITLDAQSTTTFAGTVPAGSPSVNITVPANNAVFTAPATISITANASDPDGNISKVEFYNGASKLGEDAAAPYAYSWTNVAAGNYSITAVATDNAGNKTTSAAVVVKVNVAQGPYNGKIHNIPGIIQAEEFDLGGNGFAYSDDSPGSEVTPVVNYRSAEDVDIETCTDEGGGYNIGYATAGEWLEYTVNVEVAGNYDLEIRSACNGDGRTITLNFDGTATGGTIALPNTGAWQTWKTTTVNNIPLKAGQQILRLNIGSVSYINLNYLEFKESVITGTELKGSTVVKVYPNPFGDEGIQIVREGNFHYRLTDVTGLTIEEGNSSNQLVTGENLKPGVYILSVEDPNGLYTQKVTRE
jgi:O-glycosyl hydrolase